MCIAEGEILANPRRVRRFTPEQYFKRSAEMQALFADVPSALANTVEIARRCSLSLVLGKPQLPNFPIPPVNGQVLSVEDYFRHVSFEGLDERLRHLYPDPARREAERPRYVQRLEFELATILKMGFPGYFLIVGDFIQWAKTHGCPVGPGRGSGAGSLVAYALKITDLDPLEYALLFERFLNPERVSMPDFDIDFCQANRDRVIDYVKQKYGADSVSQIATFGTIERAAGALRKAVQAVRNHLAGKVADFLAAQTDAQRGTTDATIRDDRCECGLPRMRVERGLAFRVCLDRDCEPLDEVVRGAFDREWTCPDCGEEYVDDPTVVQLDRLRGNGFGTVEAVTQMIVPVVDFGGSG